MTQPSRPTSGTRTERTYTWPEQQAGVQPNVGICFPGGGTRALCATMGQLRGLLSFGGLNHVDYISCVSGGSWASTAFAYYTGRRDLGRGVPRADHRAGEHHARRALERADVFPRLGRDAGSRRCARCRAHAGVPDDLLWAAAIGQVFFARFGLYDPKNPSYFSLDAATRRRRSRPRIRRSPNANFQVVRQPSGYKMPYLLINATIDGPTPPRRTTPIRW